MAGRIPRCACVLQSTTTMWRVKGSSSVEVPAKQAAQFYSGNVYLILHSFKESSVQKHSLFIWQVSCLSAGCVQDMEPSIGGCQPSNIFSLRSTKWPLLAKLSYGFWSMIEF